MTRMMTLRAIAVTATIDNDDSVKDVPVVMPEKKSIMQRLIWRRHIPFYQRH
jgi:hypothetical protein